jgi:Uma2 family endonuclease
VAPISQDGRRVSEAEYWRDYYDESDIHYEWNNGILEEKPVSDFETLAVYWWFMALLGHYLRVHPIGRIVCLEMGFRLPLPTGTVIRKPDLAVLRHDNPVTPRPLDASYRGVFDLCVEALSDQKRRGIERDTLVKKADYAAGGVPEYYILHREPARLDFFIRAPGGLYVPLEPEDGVIHSRVLPGLRFRVDDLIRRPAHDTLRDDPVYADYVLPGLRAAEERAAAEARRADDAARRADDATRRATLEAQARQAAEQRATQAAERAASEALARQAAEREAQEARQALARLQARLAGRAGEG